MTWDVEALMALRVDEIVQLFEGGVPEGMSLSTNEWLTLIEALTQFVTIPNREKVTRHLQAIEALQHILDAAHESGSLDRTEIVIRRLNLAAVLIGRGETGLAGLNPVSAADLFLAEVPYSLVDADALAKNWRKLDLQTIRKLRFIKNMIAPLRVIEKALPPGGAKLAAQDWLHLSDSLP
ncbi:hypothetical protein [Microbispora amethystogenes]|uniref:Uncharacterized protein n=1 Tax=Microbispora amethystogenes TaxID=1427754 RepID=A0ABQ4FIS6_9ACTN|nr:hypothetical protein [Microbispora amethystogenes]GIH34708.1 hypothetical protein Mam01_48720 [Microbispora amethystogenes]